MLKFPASAAPGVASRVLLEVRDVSVADQPSVVVASQELRGVPVAPDTSVHFELSVPNMPPQRSLSMRVQVNMSPGPPTPAGEYLTTAATAVPSTGEVSGLIVPLTKLS